MLSTFSVFLFLAGLLVAPFALLASAPAYADTPANTPFLTWNMQGATTVGQSLWTSYLPTILSEQQVEGANAPQVIMLQEAGPSAPDPSTPQPNPTATASNPSGDGRVSYVVWNRGSNSRTDLWNIYFVQSSNPEVPGGRVNTIVMSRLVANQVMVVDNPFVLTQNRPGRPAIGIRLGNDWYFSYHALTGGGGDASAMLNAIGGAVQRSQPAGVTYNWTVGGDFNTEPDSLQARIDHGAVVTPSGQPPEIVASGQATHNSGRELDYAVTTSPDSGSIEALTPLPNQGGSDHQPVAVVPTPTAGSGGSSNSTSIVVMPVGGYAMDGVNDTRAGGAGGRYYFRGCTILPNPGVACQGFRTSSGFLPSSALAKNGTAAAAAGTITLDYVGSVTAGNVAPGEDEEDAFPGESIDQIRQHLVTDLPVYKPNVILLQIDVANDLDKGVTATQEASELQDLLHQIYYILPNTTVLLGDPAPSLNAATQSEMYTGSGSYISQSDQIVADVALAGHRIQTVPLDFEDNTAGLDTTASADGVPNDAGYQDMAGVYGDALLNLESAGTIVDTDAVIVNPSGIIEDGSGVDDTGEGGSLSGGPCDIYAYYGTPCTAAYSMTREMYANYDGPLYQVTRASDGQADDIGPLAPGGVVNAPAQDSFCAGTTCRVTEIYDQSPDGNNLTIEGGGGADHSPDQGAVADALPVKTGGNEAYGLDVEPGTGYRDDTTTEIATGSQPEGMYMVASGTHVNNQCCFDFGNVETTNNDDNAGAMDAVNLTTYCGNNNSTPCDGPWVMADMENGQWTGAGSNPEQPSNTNFVTAMLKNNGTSEFALQSGDSTSGGLTKWYDGPLPGGYDPMRKEGAIVLGTGGDNSNSDIGSFFEGVMTQGYPSDAADATVQANIVAAGYGGNSSPPAGAAASAAGPAVVHQGYSSVFTVDSSNGHLRETYLPKMYDSWLTHDLGSTAPTMPDTPPVMPGTQPVALVHCGYTSVFTVDASSGDLQETYLSAVGQSWATQDLSAEYQHTPPTNVTPTAVEYSSGVPGGTAGCGYTSVFTRDRNGDLQETYLPNAGFPGDAWLTHDLGSTAPTMPDTPEIQPGTSPVAIVHCGYTSVYTVDASNHHLQETYLPAFGDSWSTQDLSRNYGNSSATTYNTPPTVNTPTAVMHSAGVPGGTADCGYTSVFTVDDVSRHLQETYLPNTGFPGDAWLTHDLGSTAPTMPDTPPVAPGTQPEVLVHMGYTSVYTVDEGSQHLQESYLPAFGDSWSTQDLTANPQYNAPLTDQSPIVLLHPDGSGNLDWTSVFTVQEFTNHLEETYLPNTGFPGDAWSTHDLGSTAPTMPDAPPVAVLQSQQADWSVAHDGYTSTYTVDGNGDLQESYLSAMGKTWVTQDLSSSAPNMAQTPAVAPGTVPIAVTHNGYTSVFTVDKGDASHAAGDLQETYLPALGGPWYTHDLSSSAPTMAKTPAVAAASSPTAVFHDGYLSVYTIDANGDLQETYLAQLGGNWVTQDLTAMTSGPKTLGSYTNPIAMVHDGYVSVFTQDYGDASHSEGDLQETYLPVLGGAWATHDLSQLASIPTIMPYTDPTVVFHDGFLSVYTVNDTSAGPDNGPGWGDLEETYLPAIGDNWVSQDLTSKYGLPVVQQYSSPVALYHTGFTSVYYAAGGTGNTSPGHLIEAYLPAISDAWGWHDLSSSPPATPGLDTSVTLAWSGAYALSPLVHYDTSGGLTWTSVFTIDGGSHDLQETWLPAIGASWSTQNLSTENPPATPPW